MTRLPIDDILHAQPPASPLVEATLALIHERVGAKLAASGEDWATFSQGGDAPSVTQDDFAAVEARVLASGHRFDWSAAISVAERPEAYKPAPGAEISDAGFTHPDAPQADADDEGRALRGVGDNVVRHDRDTTGTARSHLGILSREYNIPCVMNAKVAGIRDGDRVRIETTAAAKTTEDYQQGIERTARVWLIAGDAA